MASSEETFGAVDGVEGPDAAVGAAGAVAGVDGLVHLGFGFDGAAEVALGGGVGEVGGADEGVDLGGEGGVGAEGAGFFFADDLVVGEVGSEGVDDEGLGAEVADRDGGVVVFGEGAFGFFVEDALREEGGALDGELGYVEFFGVGHVG